MLICTMEADKYDPAQADGESDSGQAGNEQKDRPPLQVGPFGPISLHNNYIKVCTTQYTSQAQPQLTVQIMKCMRKHQRLCPVQPTFNLVLARCKILAPLRQSHH